MSAGFRAGLQIKEALSRQMKHDVDPPVSATARYMREEMCLESYRHLLAVGALACRALIRFASKVMSRLEAQFR